MLITVLLTVFGKTYAPLCSLRRDLQAQNLEAAQVPVSRQADKKPRGARVMGFATQL